MPNRPAPHSAPVTADTPPNPDREYQDATESKLDHSKPPHHEKTAADSKHKDEPQISVGKP
ncbi:hypothetical protein [Herbaspirillum rhizosphaerae]|uniref:hypothetical protein n=1 Tax=Herbaspirillum rhizosphaerae TaxID=346179 RepID=UPI00067E25E8|nr:hypothetical protein [Herbaspirillum rhizosphaerae]